MFVLGEIEVLNDKVVLRYFVDVFIGEDDIFLVVELEFDVEILLILCLYFLFGKATVPQLPDFYLKFKDHHAILPSLQDHALRYNVGCELYEHITLKLDILMIEGG